MVDDTISPAQLRRFFAIAKEAGYTPEGIDRLVKIEFSIESKSRIPRHLYDALCERLTPEWAAYFKNDPHQVNLFEHTKEEIQSMFY